MVFVGLSMPDAAGRLAAADSPGGRYCGVAGGLSEQAVGHAGAYAPGDAEDWRGCRPVDNPTAFRRLNIRACLLVVLAEDMCGLYSAGLC